MKPRNGFWSRLLGRYKPDRENNRAEGGPSNGRSAAEKLAGRLQSTQDDELSCDQVFALLDEYTELALAGQDVATLMPLAKHHIDMCPDCREEFEALQRILLASRASG